MCRKNLRRNHQTSLRGQNQPEKRDARSQRPPPTHNPRRCHLNHELVPAEENLNRIDGFPDDPVQPSVGRTLPGTSRRKQAAVRPFAGAAAAVGPGYHRALESQRQALCEPFTGQCGASCCTASGRRPPDCSPLWNAAVCWSRCRDSQTERRGGITSICPGPRNPTSCNHPSEKWTGS